MGAGAGAGEQGCRGTGHVRSIVGGTGGLTSGPCRLGGGNVGSGWGRSGHPPRATWKTGQMCRSWPSSALLLQPQALGWPGLKGPDALGPSAASLPSCVLEPWASGWGCAGGSVDCLGPLSGWGLERAVGPPAGRTQGPGVPPQLCLKAAVTSNTQPCGARALLSDPECIVTLSTPVCFVRNPASGTQPEEVVRGLCGVPVTGGADLAQRSTAGGWWCGRVPEGAAAKSAVSKSVRAVEVMPCESRQGRECVCGRATARANTSECRRAQGMTSSGRAIVVR